MSIVPPFAIIVVVALVVALLVTLPSPSRPFVVVIGGDGGGCWIVGRGAWCWWCVMVVVVVGWVVWVERNKGGSGLGDVAVT